METAVTTKPVHGLTEREIISLMSLVSLHMDRIDDTERIAEFGEIDRKLRALDAAAG